MSALGRVEHLTLHSGVLIFGGMLLPFECEFGVAPPRRRGAFADQAEIPLDTRTFRG